MEKEEPRNPAVMLVLSGDVALGEMPKGMPRSVQVCVAGLYEAVGFHSALS